MLAGKNISLKAGDKLLFTDSSFELSKGLFALLGRNGTGKSTLLSAILNEHPFEGEITILGTHNHQLNNKEKARRISIVKSRPLIYGEYSVYDILMLGRLPYQNLLAFPSEEDKKCVHQVAEDLGISEFIHQAYNSLSDGEKQLVMVGRALVQDTPIILLDEPAAFLDLVNRVELVRLLKKMANNKGKMILFSTHHVEVLTENCDGILIIDQQKLQFHQDSRTFDQVIRRTFKL